MEGGVPWGSPDGRHHLLISPEGQHQLLRQLLHRRHLHRCRQQQQHQRWHQHHGPDVPNVPEGSDPARNLSTGHPRAPRSRWVRGRCRCDGAGAGRITPPPVPSGHRGELTSNGATARGGQRHGGAELVNPSGSALFSREIPPSTSPRCSEPSAEAGGEGAGSFSVPLSRRRRLEVDFLRKSCLGVFLQSRHSSMHV